MPYANRDRANDYQREYRRIRRSGDICTTPRTAALPGEFRLKTAEDVLALLSQQVEAVRSDATVGTVEKARCIGYLAAVSLKAVEAGAVAARLEAVEVSLRRQQAQPRGSSWLEMISDANGWAAALAVLDAAENEEQEEEEESELPEANKASAPSKEKATVEEAC